MIEIRIVTVQLSSRGKFLFYHEEETVFFRVFETLPYGIEYEKSSQLIQRRRRKKQIDEMARQNERNRRKKRDKRR
jgi:hypothetical protein